MDEEYLNKVKSASSAELQEELRQLNEKKRDLGYQLEVIEAKISLINSLSMPKREHF